MPSYEFVIRETVLRKTLATYETQVIVDALSEAEALAWVEQQLGDDTDWLPRFVQVKEKILDEDPYHLPHVRSSDEVKGKNADYLLRNGEVWI